MQQQEVIPGRYAKGRNSDTIVKISGKSEDTRSFSGKVVFSVHTESYIIGEESNNWSLSAFTLLPATYTPPAQYEAKMIVTPTTGPTYTAEEREFIDRAAIGLATDFASNGGINYYPENIAKRSYEIALAMLSHRKSIIK